MKQNRTGNLLRVGTMVCVIVAVLCALAAVWGWVASSAASCPWEAEAASIGIIGGADGPTAIYVASRVSPLACLLGGAGLFGGLAAVGPLLLHRGK